MNPHRKIASNINSHYYYLGEKLKVADLLEVSTINSTPNIYAAALCWASLKLVSSERPGTLQNLPWCITCLSLFGSPIEMTQEFIIYRLYWLHPDVSSLMSPFGKDYQELIKEKWFV